VKVRASHIVEDLGEGHARMVLGIEQTGALSGLISMLYGKLTRQYVSMEAEGLKKAAETPEAEETKSEAKAESGTEPKPGGEAESGTQAESDAEMKSGTEAESGNA